MIVSVVESKVMFAKTVKTYHFPVFSCPPKISKHMALILEYGSHFDITEEWQVNLQNTHL